MERVLTGLKSSAWGMVAGCSAGPSPFEETGSIVSFMSVKNLTIYKIMSMIFKINETGGLLKNGRETVSRGRLPAVA